MSNEELLKLCNKYLNYNPLTGIILWKKRPSNRVKLGDEVGNLNYGYRVVYLKGRNYKAHRLAFLMTWEYLPKFIDHINGVRDDNRLCNLREATNSQNGQNKKIPKNNTSGYKGVHWDGYNNKWAARIGFLNKSKYLGIYKNKEDAAKAYNAAAKKLHGEFAVLNAIKGN